MPDINQLVLYKEMVCLFVPDNAGILKMTQDEMEER